MNQTDRNSIRKAQAAAGRRVAPWVAALLGVIATTAAFAQGTMKGTTGGLESGTDLVSLPGVPSGTLSATECRSGCPIYRLRFDRNTRYYIGKNPVPYAKFREAASKGDLFLQISYRLDDKTLTRLRIPAAGNP